MTTKKKTAPEGIKVTLKKEHTHAGEEKKAGDTISVRPDQEKWLKQACVI